MIDLKPKPGVLDWVNEPPSGATAALPYCLINTYLADQFELWKNINVPRGEDSGGPHRLMKGREATYYCSYGFISEPIRAREQQIVEGDFANTWAEGRIRMAWACPLPIWASTLYPGYFERQI